MFSRSKVLRLPLTRCKSTVADTIHKVPNVYNDVRSGSNIKPNYKPGLHHHIAPSTPTHTITPDVFLPESDPRKGLDLANSKKVNVRTAPALSKPRERTLNLTPVEVAEIQKLRAQDPYKWTRKALAQRFNVSGLTISLVSDVEQARLNDMNNRLEIIKKRWSEPKAQARKDRQKRKIAWYRDE